MTAASTVLRYLDAMQASNLESVLSCFSYHAQVISPTYGQVAVRPFYERLFTDTADVKVSLHAIYGALDAPDQWIAHFAYQWVRRDGVAMNADLVDFFTFDVVSGLIAQLRIVVDPK